MWDKLNRFFFCGEKAAMLENGTERQAGMNQKGPGVVQFFDMGWYEKGFIIDKNEPGQNLKTDHKTPRKEAALAEKNACFMARPYGQAGQFLNGTADNVLILF